MKRGELHPNWGRFIDFCRGHPQGSVTIHLKDSIPKVIQEVKIHVSLSNWGDLIDFCRDHPQGDVIIHLKDGIPRFIKEVLINISLDGPDTFLPEPLDKPEVALIE